MSHRKQELNMDTENNYASGSSDTDLARYSVGEDETSGVELPERREDERSSKDRTIVKRLIW